MSSLSEDDLTHLARCVELAAEALEAGDQPFGSVLVAGDGTVLHEARNHEGSGDATRHPELELAQWASRHLPPPDRATATAYTSGEHCPMCSAAHAWVGLGRIVFASSAEQTAQWCAELGAGASPVRPLPISEVAPGVPTDGPVEPFASQVRELHRRRSDRPA
ncbi:nucleoside deaminase [Nocardioides marmoribigeumensis]|uniref:tRNA(Arg) A34 adenosine deaminase TadA n=1 Tax=Nocardioides marmoribigeumensis TaxID=433649 RepID=A0ABU2C205_9ACTN|nr:nucleoside deaminase [Nocardioides marmoribigeumensis]MDR7364655.1 tRNA(Arg) A34 adenosine deaminase TadA [Nocardioides marmoribigeumensis]